VPLELGGPFSAGEERWVLERSFRCEETDFIRCKATLNSSESRALAGFELCNFKLLAAVAVVSVQSPHDTGHSACISA